MNDGTCVLCGESLSKYPTNREHYVPQVLIREFNKLCIPSRFDWALRQNEYSYDSYENHIDRILVPRNRHKEWAVVEVHEKCNLEASGMCQDLRYIIDHLDKPIPKKYFYRPIEYYAHLWQLPVDDVFFTIFSSEAVEDMIDGERIELYCPGRMFAGRITIHAAKSNYEMFSRMRISNDYEWHTIHLGTRKALSEI